MQLSETSSKLTLKNPGMAGDLNWAGIEAAAQAGKSIVALDSMGETYRQMSGRMRGQGYEVMVLNASYAEPSYNLESLVNWNPIVEIRDGTEMELFVTRIVKNSCIDFNLLASLESMLLKILVHIVKSGAFPQKISTMLSLLNLTRENIISLYEDLYEDGRFNSEDCVIFRQWLASLPVPDIEKASESLICKLSRLNKYESLNALENLIDFTRLARQRTAVFVQTPSILDYCNKKVVSLMTAFLLRRLYETANETAGKLPIAVSVFLEDTIYNIEQIPESPGIVELKRPISMAV